MSDLDSKLRKILYGNSFAVGSHPKDFVLRINEKGAADIIAQIKQAFADDAKQKLINGEIHGVGVYEVDNSVMTSQEFLNKFKEEIDNEDWPYLPFCNKQVLTYADVMKCAQRAAGVGNGWPV